LSPNEILMYRSSVLRYGRILPLGDLYEALCEAAPGDLYVLHGLFTEGGRNVLIVPPAEAVRMQLLIDSVRANESQRAQAPAAQRS
jgi:hypothetical protein